MKRKGFKSILIIIIALSILAICKLPQEQTVFKEEARTSSKVVALTFDDGPSRYTSMLLDGLKERDVKVSFFVLGSKAEKNYEILKRMSDEGHLIGNHTYSHKNLYRLSAEEIFNEIDKTNLIIESITGTSTKYFRPSYGLYNQKIEELTNMKIILWNLDTLDWKIKNSKQITRRVVSTVKDGSIILMHDVYKTSVKAALDIIDKLQEEGYTFLRVDELMLR